MAPTSTMSKTTKPVNFGPAGQRLWKWLNENFDVAGCLPAIEELCRSADGLAAARGEYAASLAAGDSTLALKWASAVSKAEASYARFWRLVGLHKGEHEAPAIPDRRR